MSPASAFSLRRSARVRRRTAGAVHLPLTLLAAAFVGGAGLRADNPSPGSLDTSFKEVAPNATTYTVRYQAETSLVGTSLIFAGGDNGNLEELFDNGVVPVTFSDPPFGGSNRIVYTSALERITDLGQPPKLLVGGDFGKSADQTKANEPAQNIFRLTSVGVIDTTFMPGKGADDYVTAILPLANGQIVVGGLFSEFNKESHKHIVRLQNDGSVDESFADGLRIDDNVLAVAEQIDPATGTANGSILIAGLFGSINGASASKLARLDINGVPDASFKPVFDTRVLAVAVQPDGKIVVGGDFTNVNGVAVSKIARLNYDGSLDTTFSGSVTGLPNGEVNPVAVYVIRQLDEGTGRLYVAGNFTQYNGVTRNYLARVNADGSLDTSFDPGTNIINRVQDIDIQPDNNKVLVAEERSRGPDNNLPPSLIRLYGDPATPVADIAAAIPTARLKPSGKKTVGEFSLTRNVQGLGRTLTVYVKLGGTATPKTDYVLLGLLPYNNATDRIYSLTFPAGVSTVDLQVNPKVGGTSGTSETVELTLVPDPTGAASYAVGDDASATVTIKFRQGTGG